MGEEGASCALVLMRVSGSAPGASEALLMVLADRSVQYTRFSWQSKAMPTTMEPWKHRHNKMF